MYVKSSTPWNPLKWKKKKKKLTANKFHILPRKALLGTTFYNGTDFCTKAYSKHGKQCILEVKKEWPLCMETFISLNLFFFEIRGKTIRVFYKPLFLILIFIQGSFQIKSTSLYLLSTCFPIFLWEFRHYGGMYPTWDSCHLYLLTFQF